MRATNRAFSGAKGSPRPGGGRRGCCPPRLVQTAQSAPRILSKRAHPLGTVLLGFVPILLTDRNTEASDAGPSAARSVRTPERCADLTASRSHSPVTVHRGPAFARAHRTALAKDGPADASPRPPCQCCNHASSRPKAKPEKSDRSPCAFRVRFAQGLGAGAKKDCAAIGWQAVPRLGSPFAFVLEAQPTNLCLAIRSDLGGGGG